MEQPDAARWTPNLDAEPDGIPASVAAVRAERSEAHQHAPGEPLGFLEAYLARDLQERAIRAEAIRRLERRATARERIAQTSGDPRGVTDARWEAQASRRARLDAEAEAYDTAALLQEDGADAQAERAAGQPQRQA